MAKKGYRYLIAPILVLVIVIAVTIGIGHAGTRSASFKHSVLFERSGITPFSFQDPETVPESSVRDYPDAVLSVTVPNGNPALLVVEFSTWGGGRASASQCDLTLELDASPLGPPMDVLGTRPFVRQLVHDVAPGEHLLTVQVRGCVGSNSLDGFDFTAERWR